MKIIKRILKLFIRRFYYLKGGEPIKCEYCGCKKLDYLIKGLIEGVSCEEKVECSNCLKEVGYWAYGSFDPSYSRDIFNRVDLDTFRSLTMAQSPQLELEKFEKQNEEEGV